MTQTVEASFAIGDRVYIDGCKGLVGVITAVTYRHPEVINYEVSWVSSGKSEASVIEGWRLSEVDE